MLYRPKDFYSDTPPPRIISSEMEYCIQDPLNSPSDFIDAAIALSGLRALPTCSHDGYHGLGFMLENGARIYQDTNRDEYASPECSDALTLALVEHRGDRLIADTALVTPGIKGAYKRIGYDHKKRATSAGYHESYLIPNGLLDIYIAKIAVASLLATRVIWAGAGIVGETYRHSQKAHGIGSINGGPKYHGTHGKNLCSISMFVCQKFTNGVGSSYVVLILICRPGSL